MTIQEILKEANHETESDNRSRTVRQINKLLSDKKINIIIVRKGFIRKTNSGFKWNIRIQGFGKATRWNNNMDLITPLNILTYIGKFLQREDVRPLINASIKLPCSCGRCNGTGNLPQFNYYANGVCFECLGSGYTSFETSVEINEKLSPEQRTSKFRLDYVKGERKNFDGLTEIAELDKNEISKYPPYVLFASENNFYVGQPLCQDNVDYIIPAEKFEAFKKDWNKTRFVKLYGAIK